MDGFDRVPTPGDQVMPEIPDVDLVRRIGQGGFGEVWLTKNRTTGQLRAVKLVPLRRSGPVDSAGREITSIIRLEENVKVRHPNLLVIHHAGKTGEHFFYIMDPADDLAGGPASLEPGYRPATLQARLENGPLPAEECLSCARQLLAGLACLHQSGMVHRDVKPANCLFVAAELKLADFGLLIDEDRSISQVGTRKYMPPDGRMDARADVYAAGLVIYEMISGRPAGRFPRLGDNGRQVAADPALSLLNRLALRACQPDPQQRFRDARQMLADLEASSQDAATGKRRSGLRVAALVACCLATAAFAGWCFWPPGPLLLSSSNTSSSSVKKDSVPVAVDPAMVNVNFITHPFEATIFLDGAPLKRDDGTEYRTPCTVKRLPAKIHRITFQHPDHGELEAGQVDFSETRQVMGRWDLEE